MTKMPDHITDGPDEDEMRERNAYSEEQEYDKYQDSYRYREESLDLGFRISLAINHISKYNSFDPPSMIQLLKDCKREVERG